MIKVQARALQPGDLVGSGEVVLSVSAGVATPRGNVDVILVRNDGRRRVTWGAYTLIGVTRVSKMAESAR